MDTELQLYDNQLVKKQIPIEEAVAAMPEKIYKLRKWSKEFHPEILTKQELYFSKVIDLGEPYDCRFPIEFNFNYDRLISWYKNDSIAKLKSKGIRPNNENVDRRANTAYEARFGTEEQRSQREKDFYNITNSTTYVFCSSMSFNRNEYWENHGFNYTGICVEIQLKSFALDMLSNHPWIGGPVRYVSDQHPPFKHYLLQENEDLREQLSINLFRTKYDRFEFEDEYRLILKDFTALKNNNYPLSHSFTNYQNKQFHPSFLEKILTRMTLNLLRTLVFIKV